MLAELATHKGVQAAETCGECRVTGGPALNPFRAKRHHLRAGVSRITHTQRKNGTFDRDDRRRIMLSMSISRSIPVIDTT